MFFQMRNEGIPLFVSDDGKVVVLI
uniref:Uncharacterized protein n=1 Tax=Rhizophora mucronata TaxID=61149 RepID=A0A2P2NCL0_RHIMU